MEGRKFPPPVGLSDPVRWFGSRSTSVVIRGQAMARIGCHGSRQPSHGQSAMVRLMSSPTSTGWERRRSIFVPGRRTNRSSDEERQPGWTLMMWPSRVLKNDETAADTRDGLSPESDVTVVLETNHRPFMLPLRGDLPVLQ